MLPSGALYFIQPFGLERMGLVFARSKQVAHLISISKSLFYQLYIKAMQMFGHFCHHFRFHLFTTLLF